ncbi:MAG: methylmalonyl-CoA carboxyltransferase [bacterium]|nr:methylmalonyl-CoA carboxyltransferase [bacterium]
MLERIERLLDSFEVFYGGQNSSVLCAIGYIGRKKLGVFSTNPAIKAGALGYEETSNIAKLIDFCIDNSIPVVGIYESSGARIEEGIKSLSGFALLFKKNVKASGKIPQITIATGTSAGGGVYSPAMTDFIVATKNVELFITGPSVIKEYTGEVVTRKELGGYEVHIYKSGLIDFIHEDFNEAVEFTKNLIEFLPASCFDAVNQNVGYFLDKKLEKIEKITTLDKKFSYDMHDIIEDVFDRFIEVKKDFAKNIITGFAEICGIKCGVVANNPANLAGAIDIAASEKAARFVRFLDAFNIPLVTFVDVPGYLPGKELEELGIIRRGAKLLFAYAECSIPLITIIIRKAYGGAYCVLGSKEIGGRYNYAWQDAEIAVMGPKGAVEILYKDAKNKEELVMEYIEKFASVRIAVENKSIDAIINPLDTRKKIYEALSDSIKYINYGFKHTNIPL